MAVEVIEEQLKDRVATNHVTAPSGKKPPANLGPLLVATRRHLHAHPELGFEEVETSKYLRALLGSYGLKIQGPVAGTGFFTDIHGAHPGPTVGYRADMDALPLQDEKQVPYASKNPGATHACGHDAHMAIGVGVALSLLQRRDALHGTVRVFFQPNEEGAPSGSVPMIREGILEGLEAAYCIHVDPTLDVGTYGLIDGTVTAATDRFHVRVIAPGTGHSARPHQAHDTIWIATQVLQQCYQLLGRITDPRNPSVLTVCRINGGTTHNVIPSEVAFEGNLRFLDETERVKVKQFLRRTTEHMATLHGVRIELNFLSGLPTVVNDTRLVQHVRDTIGAAQSELKIHDIPVPSMGSEDFANYLQYIPGILVRVGTHSSRPTSYALHDKKFDLDERALEPTARLMTEVLLSHVRGRILA